MYKYIAQKELIKKYHSITKNSKKPWDDHFFLALEICKTASVYFQVGDFWKHYKSIQFYSVKPLRQVPLNGTLIDVKWFSEIKV